MKLGPVNYVICGETNSVGAPAGIYVHALEVAAWLRDNHLDEPAAQLEHLARQLEGETNG